MTFKEVIESYPKRTESVRNRKIHELAAACHVESSTVYNWVAGRTNPSPVYRAILAEKLGKPESELFPDE